MMMTGGGGHVDCTQRGLCPVAMAIGTGKDLTLEAVGVAGAVVRLKSDCRACAEPRRDVAVQAVLGDLQRRQKGRAAGAARWRSALQQQLPVEGGGGDYKIRTLSCAPSNHLMLGVVNSASTTLSHCRTCGKRDKGTPVKCG